ncbi:unnamed protein product, partial [marine sediment metagenome]
MPAESEVTQPDILKQAERVMDLGVKAEEAHRFVYGHSKHIGDTAALEANGQCFPIEPAAPARFAHYSNIRKKAHLYFPQTLAGAGLAPPFGHIEGEPAGRITPHPGLRQPRVQLAHMVPQTDIRSRTRTGSLADRALVYFQDPLYR